MSALYYRYISLPEPKTFARYWDFSLPSAEVRPTFISKVNTFLQLGLLGGTMGWMAFGKEEDVKGKERKLAKEKDTVTAKEGNWLEQFREKPPARQAIEVGWYVVGFTTIWSGLSYVGWGRRRGLRILTEKKK